MCYDMDELQLDDNYFKFPNELLEALCRICMKPSERQIFDVIIRKTYGWGVPSSKVSIGELCVMTNLSRRTIIYGLKNLEAHNMVVVQRKRNITSKDKKVNEINSIKIQKDYDRWVVQRNSPQYEKLKERQRDRYRRGVVQRNVGSAKNDNKVVQRNGKNVNSLHPLKNTLKDINKDNISFDIFWDTYDHKHKKPKCQKKWNRLSLKDREAIMEHVPRYVKSTPDKKFRLHPYTYLNNECWNDPIGEPQNQQQGNFLDTADKQDRGF